MRTLIGIIQDVKKLVALLTKPTFAVDLLVQMIIT